MKMIIMIVLKIVTLRYLWLINSNILELNDNKTLLDFRKVFFMPEGFRTRNYCLFRRNLVIY